jgi:hypothetical protein
MPLGRLVGNGGQAFFRPEEAIASIERDGFNWRLVREYFRFTDGWLSEGQYSNLLEKALASIGNDAGRNTLLDMLDLQYAVFLEQVALQERMLGEAECDRESVAFGERVMAYLQFNANCRPDRSHRKSARTALFEIAPGQLINRLMGSPDDPGQVL